MMFGVALVPVMVAAGAGLDMARAMMARTAMSQALDAAALAVGSTANVTQAQAQAIAQKYFDQNYKGDPSYGPHPVLDPVSLHGQQVTLSAHQQVNTTLLAVGGFPSMNIGASSTVVWGQTRLWVALALDNTGSMSQTDSTGTSKLGALKTALNGSTVNNVHTPGLLEILQAAATTVGDVQATIVPFSKDVNVGTGNVNASWISWTDWESPPPNVTLASGGPDNNGPGALCPFTTSSNRLKSPYGFYCVASATNGASTRSAIPSNGLICPGADSGTYNTNRRNRYYNGCYNSTPTQTLVTTTDTATPTKKTTQTCTQVGSGSISCNTTSTKTTNLGSATASTTTATAAGYSGDSTTTAAGSPSSTTTDGSKSCSGGTCSWTRTIMDYSHSIQVAKTGAGPWTHAWVVNSHGTWEGCIMDRDQDYDTKPDTPSGAGTLFPAENAESCPPSVITPLPATWTSSQWTALSTQVTAMQPNGSTNQTIGLAHAMQTLMENDPYGAPALPAYTTRYIILLSDGLNTQNRWNGDGSNQSIAVDNRMAMACTKAKQLGFVIYTIYVDLAGTQGNSSVLQNCASDPGKYFDLTTSGAIVTAFNTIGQQITALHVSQ